jgi:hypothetical protein
LSSQKGIANDPTHQKQSISSSRKRRRERSGFLQEPTKKFIGLVHADDDSGGPLDPLIRFVGSNPKH